MKKPVVNNKKKQLVQDEEVFLYKNNISSSRPKTPELMFIQDEVNNLDKYMKYLQLLITTTLFYLPPHYKSI